MDFSKLSEVFKSKGILEFEVYQIQEKSIDVQTFNGNIDSNNVENKNELSIRGVYNNHISTVYTQNDSDEEINFLADKIIDNCSCIESSDPYIIFEGSKEYLTLPEVKHDYNNYSQADLIALCQKGEKYIKDKCEYVDSTAAQVGVSYKTVSIKNSKGLNISREEAYAVYFVESVIKKDGDVKSGYYLKYLDNFSDINFDEVYEESTARTLASIGASSLATKGYKVVFENKTACSLLGCFSSMFSADSVIKKISILANKLNEKVFGDNINIVDDPIPAKSFSKYTFDDEGVATYKKNVVENGVLKTYLHDLRTAKMMNVEPTGNGFRFGKGAPANLCFMPTTSSLDELIKDIDEGVFITGLMGQHAGVNQTSGSFSLQASGFKIENGKITEPVTLIIVSGNIIDLLNNVNGIANDIEYRGHIGCGSLYVNSLSISGNK